MPVPKDFLWGVATSSYQIEGSPLADGGGPCIWHEFSHTQGNIVGDDTGDVACDHYHRWQEDIGLMRELGVKGYRFSIRWPRVIPLGTGTSNEAGFAFYDRLVDGLLASGIEPYVTLYHWDLPAALHHRGGWLNPEIVSWFADYAQAVAKRLGDRVSHFITLNEPWVTAIEGHVSGEHAPGLHNLFAGLRAVRTQTLAHLAAYDAIKSESKAQVGITLSNGRFRPERPTDEDRKAAAAANAFVNYPLFLDPLVKGSFPEEIRATLQPYLTEDGFEQMATSIPVQVPDFVGMNYYFATYVTADQDRALGFREVEHPEKPLTSMGWIIDPDGIYELLRELTDRYGKLPIYITENGAAFEDTLAGGEVHDPDRTAYLAAHVGKVLEARKAGVDVRGYFLWSLMDNYEWGYGYSKRFGIVHVDQTSLARTTKDSGRWYQKVCRGELDPTLPLAR